MLGSLQLPDKTCSHSGSCCHGSSVVDFLTDGIRCCCTITISKISKLLLLLAMLLTGNRRCGSKHGEQYVSACHLHVNMSE